MRNFVDCGHQEGFDGALLFGRQLAEPRALAFEFGARDLFQLLLERGDRRAEVERAQRLLKLHDFGFDDQLGSLGFAFALADV